MTENAKANATILVVDDETALRKAIALDFKRRGYQVLEAGNGRDAFEIVKSNKVNVVLTDVRMPGGDGVEFLDRLRGLNSDIPVVMFITGFADITLEEAYDKGVHAVFEKPFDRKQLIEAVTKVLAPKEEAWANRPQRFKVDFKVSLKFDSFEKACTGRVVNVGLGGFFVALDEPLPAVGAEAAFEITFEQGKPCLIDGTGIVRWVRTAAEGDKRAGCGIEFQYLSDKSRSEVAEFISHAKTRSFIPKS